MVEMLHIGRSSRWHKCRACTCELAPKAMISVWPKKTQEGEPIYVLCRLCSPPEFEEVFDTFKV